MKKIIMSAISAVILCACAQAQTDTNVNPNVNPLNVARALALNPPSYFQCSLSDQMLISNVFQPNTMQFVMRKSDFGITNLVINQTNSIALPAPIYGIPLGDGGLMRNVFLNVNALGKDGEYVGNGYLQLQSVSKNDSITVTIAPNGIKQEIPVDVGEYGNDIGLTIDNFIYGYGYGVDNGKFYVYLPPVGGTYHYTLRQLSTGKVIGQGWLTPFENAVTPTDAYFGINYMGNVLGVDFPDPIGFDSWIGVPNINFNCSVPMTTGTNVLGKVLFTDAGSGGIEIIAEGQYWIYIQTATSNNGDMPLVPLQDYSSSQPGWYETHVATTTSNIGKVVITIIPKPGNTIQNPWVNLHRFYGSPTVIPVVNSGGN